MMRYFQKALGLLCIFISILLVSMGSIANTAVITDSFEGVELNRMLWSLSESPSGVFTQKDGTLFKTEGTLNTYKWANLSTTYSVSGDFEISIDWAYSLLDHWNEIRFTGWVDDNNYIQILRQQKNVGEHMYSIVIKINGHVVETKSVSTQAKSGSFKITRKKGKITGYIKDDSHNNWVSLAESKNFPDAGLKVSFGIGSPPLTSINVIFSNFLLITDTEVLLPQFYYGTSILLADQTKGRLSLVHLEKGEMSANGSITIMPGGRAVYAVKGPMNVKDPYLMWKSSGALKISAVQLGTAETIELSETLLWDEADREVSPETRSISLNNFITRMASRRNWNITYFTANNIFFVTFKPALGKKVVINSLKLFGCPLLQSHPITQKYQATNMDVINKKVDKENDLSYSGEYLLLKWESCKENGRWWDEKQLPTGREIVMKGIPFIITPTVLEKKFDNFTIPVGQKAGIIHFAHTSGYGVPEKETHVATYIIKYADGSTQPIFVELEWNCGVYDSGCRSRKMANFTWWGPPSFTWAGAHYIGEGTSWNSIYVASYINLYPEKQIKEIIITLPSHKSPFALLGITLSEPKSSFIGLIEPASGGMVTYDNQCIVDVMIWNPCQNDGGGYSLYIAKNADLLEMTHLDMNQKGPFAFATFTFHLEQYGIEPGPVKFKCKNTDGYVVARSSLLGWMPVTYTEKDKKFFFTMIGAGSESRGELERIKRLGYDALKAHMSWGQDEPEEGKFDFERWDGRLKRIADAGLKVSIRNNIRNSRSLPSYLQKKVCCKVASDTKQATDLIDMADPLYVSALTRYYGEVARLLLKYPHILSINANYGTRSASASQEIIYTGEHQMEKFREFLNKNYSLTDVQKKTGMSIHNWNEITAESILNDTSDFLLKALIRSTDQTHKDLIRKVVESIRNAGYNGHLAFNVAYHYQNHRLAGSPFDEYLRMGLEYPPASPYHETSDRYCLSFSKWLSAKRTFNLPYGDEGNQNPPTYEHNVLAYQWMLMFQCWDAEYCQWFFGNPGPQNIAWLKPFYHLIFSADYIPDPISLALSFESGFEEVPTSARTNNYHGPIMSHYGLANTLRAININADNYIMDYFPLTDKKVNKVLIDDISRFISDEFAVRLEKFIKDGGVFIVTGETDILQNHKFLKKFGIEVETIGYGTSLKIEKDKVSVPGGKWKILQGEGIEPMAYWTTGDMAIAKKKIGKGMIVVFGKAWSQDSYDHNLPKEYIMLVRDILCNLGNFSPVVKSDIINVACTPYRAKDGTILVHIFNVFAKPQTLKLSLRKDLLPDAVNAIDLRSMLKTSGQMNITDNGGYWETTISDIPPLHSTVIKFVNKRR